LPVAVQTLLDGTFTFRLRTVDGYVQAINGAASQEAQIRYLTQTAGMTSARAQTLLQPIRVETRYLYNEELREIWSVAPALVMFILTLTCPLLMALSVVREKETGTIYNIYSSTISRAEFLAGKLLPNIGVSLINGVVLVLMAAFYFGAPLRGSVPFLIGSMLIFVTWATSMGLLVSVLVHTQIAAIMITVVFAMVLVMQFSGMLIPVASMPDANYVIAHGMAPMHFNEIIMHTFLKGAGFVESWREVAALVALMLGFLSIGYLSFHKRSAS
jgi:ABC-2 type transport system permease protein/ribosome-dependent ATPase